MKPTLLMDIQDARSDANDLLKVLGMENAEKVRSIMQTFEEIRREVERWEALFR